MQVDSEDEQTVDCKYNKRARVPEWDAVTRCGSTSRCRRTPSRNNVALCLPDDGAITASSLSTAGAFVPLGFTRESVIDADTLRVREDVAPPGVAVSVARAFPEYSAPLGFPVTAAGREARIVGRTLAGYMVRAAGRDRLAKAELLRVRSSAWERCVSRRDVELYRRKDAYVWRRARGFSVWMYSRDEAGLDAKMALSSSEWVGRCSRARRFCAEEKTTYAVVHDARERADSVTLSPSSDD